MWSEINAQYREYEICCRDAATFVSSFKPVMSSALMQAALQVRLPPPSMPRPLPFPLTVVLPVRSFIALDA